ncbi:hypothetical protein BATDEDRAFT_86853 [Batrachochytrium dendrobatidis JAM81]|uniref:Early meiotic induction protein 1 n=1 Tax=Batrachochytrium dendrobatidis (strain JAM81 / FGSC 10211) TaxID=684364 RepID=F4NZ01_BATDJ|nr:uncharacterized protein BATDEDRAFT_86853 [Batrachochytrium dendrobatidis JAM81]EGF82117.1 hypothetical protein BATDEDRAFT_86853 [Batrachochytrium dendrobatidis JAM81]KAJ8324714.1 hypothetical protein O5D80_006955 [Batrachochytrium dendrobatidis]KAK5670962.1 hypothetical protein QVD99_002733 [Batrachochytrium dendrobatidis]|eukprot:XP_006677645.1 hypothetical protein BATDEDRAFT_86853 [Batrachochytrium dendrobatidis JAM81]
MDDDLDQEYSCSVLGLFNDAQICYTMLPQLKSYYRYGTWKDCSPQWKEFRLCVSLQATPKKEKQEILRAHAKLKKLEKFQQRSSLDVWKLREQPLPSFPIKP